MKTSLALAALALLASTSAFAGAANADLKCKSAKGLVIEGSVPGDFAEFDVTVSKDGRAVRIYSVMDQGNGNTEENATLSVLDSLSDSVWTLNANLTDGTYGYLQLFALPKTVKYSSHRNGHSAKFTAKANLRLNGIEGDNYGEKLSCTLDYSI